MNSQYNCNINARFIEWIFYLQDKQYIFSKLLLTWAIIYFPIVMRLLLTMSCCDKTNAFVRHWVRSCAIESELFRTGYAKQGSLFMILQKLNFYRNTSVLLFSFSTKYTRLFLSFSSCRNKYSNLPLNIPKNQARDNDIFNFHEAHNDSWQNNKIYTISCFFFHR